jgi:GxxExxY protein
MKKPPSHRATEHADTSDLTGRIIGAAIEVHKALGPGLLESIYEAAMCIELEEQGVPFVRKFRIPTYYKGRPLGTYEIDLLVDDRVVVELKSVAHVLAVFEAQLLTYMRLTGKHVGLLINFNSRLLKDGVMRRAL